MYSHKPIKILQFLSSGKIQKRLTQLRNIFSIFNNKPSASWVTDITTDFPTCYSCSYYSSMVCVRQRLLLKKTEPYFTFV